MGGFAARMAPSLPVPLAGARALLAAGRQGMRTPPASAQTTSQAGDAGMWSGISDTLRDRLPPA